MKGTHGYQAASATSLAEVPWGGTAAVLSLWRRGTGRLEKPRAMGWLINGLFTSAANSWSSPESDPTEEVETSSWTPQPQGRTPLLCSSSSSVLFPASFFLLQGGREHRKKLGEAPKRQLQESIAVLVTRGY